MQGLGVTPPTVPLSGVVRLIITFPIFMRVGVLAFSCCPLLVAGTMTCSRSESLATSLRGAPRLGLGMASLGRPGYINLGHGEDLPTERTKEAMQQHAHSVLDAAFDLGIRYIDMARSYGLSEEFVASWLASRPEAAAQVVCGSKWGCEQ